MIVGVTDIGCQVSAEDIIVGMIVWTLFLAIGVPVFALTLYVIKIGGAFFFLYAWTFLCMTSVVSPVSSCSLSVFCSTSLLRCALAVAQCIVIARLFVRGWVCVCVYVGLLHVCYHDNSKLRASTSPNWVCR